MDYDIFEAYEKYKNYIPYWFDEESKRNDPDDPDGYEWEWKKDTPEEVIKNYNNPKHYWNSEISPNTAP